MDIVEILKALSDETRLRIINLLYAEELCVCDIIAALEITQTKASRHLQHLKKAGLVKDRKSAQWVYYSLETHSDLAFIDQIIHHNVRKQEPFIADLMKLKAWQQNKAIEC